MTDKIIAFCKDQNWQYFFFENEYKLLERVKEEKNWDYEGPTKGIQIQTDEKCEPLIFEFDKDLYIQEYCKTQFADIDIHIQIINLLRSIKDYFTNLKVVDEGLFWDTDNGEILTQNFEDFFYAMENAIQENPKLSGPFKLESGRIVDLMS
ncbi:MAG: hypothetical protein K0M56_06675 [Kaistella sp.]|nr:hypothetical protein [Kaistella sp.]